MVCLEVFWFCFLDFFFFGLVFFSIFLPVSLLLTKCWEQRKKIACKYPPPLQPSENQCSSSRTLVHLPTIGTPGSHRPISTQVTQFMMSLRYYFLFYYFFIVVFYYFMVLLFQYFNILLFNFNILFLLLLLLVYYYCWCFTP